MYRIYPPAVILTLVAKSRTTGELVGFVCIRPKRCFPLLSKNVRLQGSFFLGVRDDYQRSWIGTRLGSKGIELAKKNGIRKAAIRVHVDNSRAIMLWEKKFGCKKVGVTRGVTDWRGNRYDMIEMELDLDEASG